MVPPALALGYSVSSSIFLAYFGEASWFEYASHWLSRTTSTMLLLLAASSNTNKQPANQTTPTAGGTAPFLLGLLLPCTSSLLSATLIYRTRKLVIEGGIYPPPPQQETDKIHHNDDLKGKIYIVTGGNTGIGKETVAFLVQRKAHVIMACRSLRKAQAAKHDILQKYYPHVQPDQMQLLQLDLSSLQSVREAASSNVISRYPKIDGLVNNAGVMMGTQEFTQDGYEVTMQANHLGHYFFTRLLLDRLKDGRIVNVSSSTYTFCERMDVEDLFAQHGRKYTLFGQYAQSKLANLLFTNELASRGYNAYSLHPGMVRTDVTRNMPWYLKYPNQMFAYFVAIFQKTPTQGAWNTIYVLTRNNHGNDAGSYWVNRKIQPQKATALDKKAARDLWNKSAKLVGLDP